MIVTGYQTLEDRDNIDHVETVGPFPCSRGDAWLSNGCYLWDTNMKWAIEWGQNSFGKKGRIEMLANFRSLLVILFHRLKEQALNYYPLL